MGTMERTGTDLHSAAAELVTLLDDKGFQAVQTAEHWERIFAAQDRVRDALRADHLSSFTIAAE